MTAYNKALAAVISVVIVRLILQWSGFDLVALGVADQFRDLVSYGIDAVAAAITGFFVWLVPNVKKEVAKIEGKL